MKKIISIKKIFVVVALAFIGTSSVTCGGAQNEPTPEPPDIDQCTAACDHIGPKEVYYSSGEVKYHPNALNCEEGQPIDMEIPGGLGCEEGIDEVFCVSCEKFCRDTMKQRVWLEPSCVVKIKSCDEIESCAPDGAVD